MLDGYFIQALLGLILGFLAGIGVGGGSLLLLWLTFVMDIDQQTGRTINLMFFIAASGCVSCFRLAKRSISLSAILPAAAAGCLGAALCSWLGPKIDQDILRKGFGILLLMTGIKEVFYRPRNAR